MKKLTVIVNPQARAFRRGGIPPASIAALVGDRGRVLFTESLAQLPGAVRRALQTGPSGTVAFVGGDGTLSQGISALVRSSADEADLPQLLLCPTGTFNYVARNLGHRGGALDGLSAFVQGGLRARKAHPVLQLDWQTQQHFGFFFAWGVGYRMLRHFYAQGRKHKPGAWTAMRVVAEGIMHAGTPIGPSLHLFRSRDCDLHIDGHSSVLPAPYSLVAGTIDSVSLGLRPFPERPPQAPPRLRLTAHSMPRLQLLRHLPQVIYAAPGRDKLKLPGLMDAEVANSAHCVLDEGFTIDGEVFDLSEPAVVTLRYGPRLRIWQMPAGWG
ncbi:MAG: diacylglycerol/lipid kinase family protein [Polyangiales bacterium]